MGEGGVLPFIMLGNTLVGETVMRDWGGGSERSGWSSDWIIRKMVNLLLLTKERTVNHGKKERKIMIWGTHSTLLTFVRV